VLFPLDTRPFLMVLANVGLVLFMFVVGFEVDIPALSRLRGSATSVAAASVLVPFGTGVAITWWIRPAAASTSGPASTQLVQALFIGVAFSATAFPVLARILDDTAFKRLSIRGLALSAAAAGDVVAWTMLAALVAVTRQAGSASTLILMAQFVVLLVVLRYVVRPVIAAILGRTRIDRAGLATTMSVMLVGIFLSSCVTAAMHLHPIFGFSCPRNAVCAKVAVEKLADASKILMPVFFVLTGLSMSVRNFGSHEILITFLVIISASAGKVLSVYVTARACKVSNQDSWGLGLLMNTRGLTELVILDVGRTAGVLSDRMFTVLAMMAIATTLITGPVLERLYFSSATVRFVWYKKWRGRRGWVKSNPLAFEHASASGSPLGNRYVTVWPAGTAMPNEAHHRDSESAEPKPPI
jgi:Kef-type K+ transport system membrane component KefB